MCVIFQLFSQISCGEKVQVSSKECAHVNLRWIFILSQSPNKHSLGTSTNLVILN